MKSTVWICTIKVRSKNGKPPIVRAICGDTIFCTLTENEQSATWTLKKERRTK